jgi:hypothetical protein
MAFRNPGNNLRKVELGHGSEAVVDRVAAYPAPTSTQSAQPDTEYNETHRESL